MVLLILVFFVLVVVFLCCYVVKLDIAKKNRNNKNTPKKVEVLPGIFYNTSYGCMAKIIVFFSGPFCCFFLAAQKHF